MKGTVPLTNPSIEVRLTNANLLTGKPVAPLDKLKVLSDSDFTVMVTHWAIGFLSKKYVSVVRCDGAGDKGRDVIGVVDAISGKWDNYQCKNYSGALGASKIWIELGKLCYYTWRKDFEVPENYYFVAPEGVTPTLHDLLNNADKLKKGLIENWTTHCESKITSTDKIELKDDLKTYVESFNFAIFKSKDPSELIEEMRSTPYYGYWFGLATANYKPAQNTPDLSDKENELQYVKQLLKVYNNETTHEVEKITDIESEKGLYQHFHRQRVCFYCAETLREFARDSWPAEAKVFENLMEEIYHGVSTRMSQVFAKPILKVDSVLELSSTLSLTGNPLVGNLEIQEKHGICHHLVNEKRIYWIEE